jgi:hypothetical protein
VHILRNCIQSSLFCILQVLTDAGCGHKFVKAMYSWCITQLQRPIFNQAAVETDMLQKITIFWLEIIIFPRSFYVSYGNARGGSSCENLYNCSHPKRERMATGVHHCNLQCSKLLALFILGSACILHQANPSLMSAMTCLRAISWTVP